jgi:hypothetical protein
MDGGLIKHKTRFRFLGSGSTPQGKALTSPDGGVRRPKRNPPRQDGRKGRSRQVGGADLGAITGVLA